MIIIFYFLSKLRFAFHYNFKIIKINPENIPGTQLQKFYARNFLGQFLRLGSTPTQMNSILNRLKNIVKDFSQNYVA